MLIHITPRIYIPHLVRACELVSLNIAELGVSLTSADLATRQPYPNKRLWAACKRVGQKAISGVLFETDEHVSAFTSIARWAVDGELLVTHTTRYNAIDDKYDCVTDNMILWYGISVGSREWEERWADWAKDLSPSQAQPRMEIVGTGPLALPHVAHRQDRVSSDGVIMERTEEFGMLTVQRERVLNAYNAERVPHIDCAFRCTLPIPA